MADDHPLAEPEHKRARRLREEAAEIRRGLAPVVDGLREQRAALQRALRAVREVLGARRERPPQD